MLQTSTHLCQDLFGSKERKETRGREVNIFERSLSSNTPWLGLDKKKSGNGKQSRRKRQGRKEGAFTQSCFRFLQHLKLGKS